jgi:hypothetical protein
MRFLKTTTKRRVSSPKYAICLVELSENPVTASLIQNEDITVKGGTKVYERLDDRFS